MTYAYAILYQWELDSALVNVGVTQSSLLLLLFG